MERLRITGFQPGIIRCAHARSHGLETRDTLASMRHVIAFLLVTLSIARVAAAVTLSASFPQDVRAEPASGRLLVYLIRTGAHVSPMHKPADGFVEEDPQPIYGIDVTDLKPTDAATVDDAATSFPVKLSELPPGKY